MYRVIENVSLKERAEEGFSLFTWEKKKKKKKKFLAERSIQ